MLLVPFHWSAIPSMTSWPSWILDRRCGLSFPHDGGHHLETLARSQAAADGSWTSDRHCGVRGPGIPLVSTLSLR